MLLLPARYRVKISVHVGALAVVPLLEPLLLEPLLLVLPLLEPLLLVLPPPLPEPLLVEPPLLVLPPPLLEPVAPEPPLSGRPASDALEPWLELPEVPPLPPGVEPPGSPVCEPAVVPPVGPYGELQPETRTTLKATSANRQEDMGHGRASGVRAPAVTGYAVFPCGWTARTRARVDLPDAIGSSHPRRRGLCCPGHARLAVSGRAAGVHRRGRSPSGRTRAAIAMRVSTQLSREPAAAQASTSDAAWGSDVVPPSGIVPPSQVKIEPGV
jgi:hypothetical protein